MLPLLNAIHTHFASDASLTSAFPGGLHRDRAPEQAAIPYVVSRVVSSAIEFAYGGSTRTRTQVRFSAFGVGHDATGNRMAALTTSFDNTALSLTSGVNDMVIRKGEPV